MKLVAIFDDPLYEEEIERTIKALFYSEFYSHLIEIMNNDARLENRDAQDPLVQAILGARISFFRGRFRGKFNARVTKQLKKIGAKWIAKEKAFRILSSDLPPTVKQAISSSLAAFDRKAQLIDRALSQFLPEEIAEKLSIAKILNTGFLKVDRKIQSALTVAPNLTDEIRERLSSQYENNYRLEIKNWTSREIVKLRKQVQASAFAGNRYEYLVDKIKKSHGVSEGKAKFLARQETKLVMSTYKETRWKAAGVTKYEWKCVAGSPGHPVRAIHKALEGRTFSWDAPPVVNDKGDRKNPGCDFGCRCYALAIVKFNE